MFGAAIDKHFTILRRNVRKINPEILICITFLSCHIPHYWRPRSNASNFTVEKSRIS